MKKTILIMAGMFAAVAGFAQTAKVDSANNLKPNAQTFTTELNVNPFNGQLNLNNSLNQIKFRYFTTPTVALRVGFNISRIDSVNNVDNPYGTNSYFSDDDKHATTIGINLGIEKHFAGTRRLSPYIGADLSITDKFSGETTSNNQTTTTVTNGWNYTYISNGVVYAQSQQNAYTRIGVNLFTGFDFYIAKHFFFGYEIDYSIANTSWKEVSVTTTPSSGTSTSGGSTKNSNFTFGPSLMNGIRLGYSF
ncbi:MAG: hypothetical protein ACTHJ8_06230 [Mucilaginibacter sp.]